MLDILQTIEDNNLSIYRIPNEVLHTYNIENFAVGDTILYCTVDDVNEQAKEDFIQNFPNGRQFCRKTKIPENAGKYMCKSIKTTNLNVKWNVKTDNLADTLPGSILLFLEKENKNG